MKDRCGRLRGAEPARSSISECESSGWTTGLLSILKTFAKGIVLQSCACGGMWVSPRWGRDVSAVQHQAQLRALPRDTGTLQAFRLLSGLFWGLSVEASLNTSGWSHFHKG